MPINILVVDDSSLMRRLITRFLEEDGEIRVIDTASNGEEAIQKVKALKPQVVTLDVEMPVLDGLATLGRLMKQSPVPVIMLSAHTTEGARSTMQALALGAVDFVAKPTKPGEMTTMVTDLRYKIKAAAQASLRKIPITAKVPLVRQKQTVASEIRYPVIPGARTGGRFEIVVIGSSTGGPAALQQIIPRLPENLPVGVVIVQHIPAGFSGPLAEHLDRNSKVKVKHAEQGDRIIPGQVLVSPAGFDLTFRGRPGSVSVNLDPGSSPVAPGGFRPSVDVVMKSAAKVFSRQTMAVLLTGMGKDGAQGMLSIRTEKGYTVAEAESTCVVFGMPKAAIDIGGVEKVLPLGDIAAEIVKNV
ncbi:MAG: protein-glutamate methylesterase/protein-glutamine glutaminase [Desulfocucumaceae bacterium]